MTTEYTSENLIALQEQYREIKKFEAFVIDRFAAYARTFLGRDIKGEIQMGGGQVSFGVDMDSLYAYALSSFSTIHIIETLSYGGPISNTYSVPREFLFYTPEQEASYVNFQSTIKGRKIFTN